MVLSGGMDSVTMLHDYADDIALAVTFGYGSNHNAREAECARLHCKLTGIELIEIDLAFIGRYFESSLLSGADAIPEGHYTADNMKSTVVPFRNGIMLAVAAGLAESRGLKAVMIANHAGDHAIYPTAEPVLSTPWARQSPKAHLTDLSLELPIRYSQRATLRVAVRSLALTIRPPTPAIRDGNTIAESAAHASSVVKHLPMPELSTPPSTTAICYNTHKELCGFTIADI